MYNTQMNHDGELLIKNLIVMQYINSNYRIIIVQPISKFLAYSSMKKFNYYFNVYQSANGDNHSAVDTPVKERMHSPILSNFKLSFFKT